MSRKMFDSRPDVKIVPGQENVIKMTADTGMGKVTVSINGEQTFNHKADLNPDGEAKNCIGWRNRPR